MLLGERRGRRQAPVAHCGFSLRTPATREDDVKMFRRRRGASTFLKFDRRKKYVFLSQKELKQMGCATLPVLLLLVVLAVLVMG